MAYNITRDEHMVDCFPFVYTVEDFAQRIPREPEKDLNFTVGPMQV